MNILAISIAPIFEEHVQGGSQRVFMDVMNYLSKSNHIRTFCARREDNNNPFDINSNFKVFPVLPFKQFPFPYMTNPKNLVDIIKILTKESEWADVIYIHADGFLFKKFLKVNKPIIVSLHDFVYPISITSAFLENFDKIIFPSKYLKKCFEHTVGTIYSGIESKLKIIKNGINDNIFFRDDSRRRELKEKLNIQNDEKIILFPHRPESSKGIDEVLNLLEYLIKNDFNIRLLLSKHIDALIDDSIKEEYENLKIKLSRKGIMSNVSFFDWVSPSKMRHIYSLADITLNLGNFVEAFGLVPLESLLCETPIISTKAGCLRYNLPAMEGVETIDYNDSKNLRRKAVMLLKNKPENFGDIHEYIHENFNYNSMLREYEKLFNNIKLSDTSQISINKSESKEVYELSPWCYVSDRGVYSDYLGKFIPLNKKLLNFLKSKKKYNKKDLGKSFSSLVKFNIVIPKNE